MRRLERFCDNLRHSLRPNGSHPGRQLFAARSQNVMQIIPADARHAFRPKGWGLLRVMCLPTALALPVRPHGDLGTPVLAARCNINHKSGKSSNLGRQLGNPGVKHELEKTQLNAPARYVGGDALPQDAYLIAIYPIALLKGFGARVWFGS